MRNKKPLCKAFVYILVGFAVLITSNCIHNTQEEPSSPSRTVQPSATFEQPIIKTSTISAQPTIVLTRSPTPPTEPTWTPLPTVHPDTIDRFIESMTGKCELPCWGNITPGKTSELEAKHIVTSFGTIVESTSVYFNYRKKPAVIDFTFKDGLVSSINLPPELTESYRLHNLLTRYNLPEDVRIEVIPETADGTSWFYLAVSYPQKGVLAVFSGEGKIMNSAVNACLEKTSPDLYLVSSDNYSMEQMDEILDPVLRSMLEPLESLTGINQNQFYDIYSKHTEECLATTVHVP